MLKTISCLDSISVSLGHWVGLCRFSYLMELPWCIVCAGMLYMIIFLLTGFNVLLWTMDTHQSLHLCSFQEFHVLLGGFCLLKIWVDQVSPQGGSCVHLFLYLIFNLSNVSLLFAAACRNCKPRQVGFRWNYIQPIVKETYSWGSKGRIRIYSGWFSPYRKTSGEHLPRLTLFLLSAL